MEHREHEDRHSEPEYLSGSPKKGSGNGIIWGSVMIAVALLVSSITYAAVVGKYPAPAASSQSSATQDQGSYAAPANNFAAPSCGVQ